MHLRIGPRVDNFQDPKKLVMGWWVGDELGKQGPWKYGPGLKSTGPANVDEP